jgi:hypothetical protein
VSLETRYFFPFSRVLFLVAALLATGAVFWYAAQAISYSASLGKDVRIDPQSIASEVQPFKAATNSGTPSPFGTAVPPDRKLSEKYPRTKLVEVFKALPPQLQTTANADSLLFKVQEAEVHGDTAKEYADNAAQVLAAVPDQLRAEAFTTFHGKRIAALEERKAEEFKNKTESWRSLMVAGFSVLAILQISLILAVLAIERNTRLAGPSIRAAI